MDNYKLRPPADPNHTETSRTGKMFLFSVAEQVTCPVPPRLKCQPHRWLKDPFSRLPLPRMKGLKWHIKILWPLYIPSFKKSLPSQITMDQLDEFSTYFSIPFDKVDIRLPLPGDQVILPCVEVDSTDPDLTPGYTAIYVESFSYGMRLPFLLL
ncbi:hypothetical protein LIER_43019 [Lithospermum erythrorhizon]|uniref:Uncharacterized protein n=1 Tax=Lithospermum erythrorhizon TaxID=34254 RepID=A0AAV3PEY1_LITER